MQVNLTPEIVRVAQTRAEESGLNLSDELARVAFEEMVFNLDPELGFLVEADESLNSVEVLANAIRANDVVINNHRIDVRAIDENEQVSIPRVLINSPVLNLGTFAIKIEDNQKATFCGYFSIGSLISSTNYNEERTSTLLNASEAEEIDLTELLKKLCDKILIPLDKAVKVLPEIKELEQLVRDRSKITQPRQKEVITAICAHPEIKDLMRTFKIENSNGMLTKVLRSGSQWNKRTEEMAVDLSSKFKSLSKDEIKKTLNDIGETYGGQPEAPKFKKAARAKLAQEHLARKLGKEKLARFKSIIDQVIDGSSVVDAVKAKVQNNFAVDLAVAIKKNRSNVGSFVAATAEEIGMAFQQLAVQPAYATHSSTDDGGVDSINEALELLEACEELEELN